MKRFWLVLLSLGLMVAFSTSATAVDVKFSGEYYAAGMYLDKTNVTKTATGGNPSTAFYYQRLRARTDFTITPGLKLITRFDAMERAWGATRFVPGTIQAADSAGTRAENENIAIDWVYIDYKSAIGTFQAGYMNDGSTGTIFANSYGPKARIKYSNAFGPITLNLAYTKEAENSRMAINAVNRADADNDKYGMEGVYNWKTGKAGVNVNYYHQNRNRPAVPAYRRTYFLVTPYAFAKIGPVALQAELNYLTGSDQYEDGTNPAGAPGIDKVNLAGISGWIDATANFGLFYAGGSIAYVSGDDPGTNDKTEGGMINGGRDWNPCLIMWNYDRTNWAGALTGYNGAAQDTAMANGWLFQMRGGVKPIDKLDVMASVTYAFADQKPWATAGNPATAYLYNDYGWEVDLTATYKITNNLSYMLGGGYLFTGKYYKGTSDANELTNDFLVLNKLTLTF